MAKSTKERSAKSAQKRIDAGEKEITLRLPLGARQSLARLMKLADIDEQGEALTWMIHHVHGLGCSGVTRLLSVRHEIEDSQNVAHGSPIRFWAKSGTPDALNDLVEWIGANDQSSAIRLVIHALHEAGPQKCLRFLEMPPRKPYELTAHVAAKLQLAYNREALRICVDE